jgi:outer membrane protein assembly factor BamA
MIKNILITTVLINTSVYAQSDSKDWLVLPYGFSSEATGVTAGVAVIKKGLLQPQTTLIASVFAGLDEKISVQGEEREESFSGGLFYFSDYKLPFSQRLYFSTIAFKSYYPKAQYYLHGSNDSNKDEVLTTSGEANFVYTTFKYLLPTEEASKETAIGIKTFYEETTFENASKDTIASWKTNGLRFFLSHDTTDFPLNPSKGYHVDLQYSKDYGQGDSSQSWDFLEFKYNHYVNLETFSFTKQNVLAMSLWTGYSFSWDNDKEIYEGINAHRPPSWEGGRLGGLFKMRGYAQNRFSDKAVVYASAEYRTTLNYNPLKNNEYVDVDWLQVVAFVEAGRVNEEYNFDLLTEVKYDGGLSLRALVAKVPIRFDVAYSEEGIQSWVMVNHPFDF